VRGLRSGVDDEIRTFHFEKIAHRLTVAYIQWLVTESTNGLLQISCGLIRGTGSAKKELAHIVIDSDNLPSLLAKEPDAFGTNQTATAGN
jgi:hypothetical protein